MTLPGPRSLADLLVASCELCCPGWYEAFAGVPRDRFLPCYFALDGGRWKAVADGDADYATRVYRNEVIVTQLDQDDARWQQARSGGPVYGTPTCSSTQPSLMALMLEALDVCDRQRVLEVGTGTGYNAALLCHRLGDARVSSIECDSRLAGRANTALSACGYRPTLITGDGAGGYPGNAPYDRLIATYSTPRIPAGWLDQVRPGGVILTHLYRGLGGNALVRLTVGADGVASGRFLPQAGNFMPTRFGHHINPDRRLGEVADQRGTVRAAELAIDLFTGGPEVFFLSLATPDVAWLDFYPDDGQQTWLFHPDGSWACLDAEAQTVEQAGPRALWNDLETAARRWRELGEPTRERFGLTVHPDRTHHLWLDEPGHQVG